jgi:S-adenosylmethionine decarboxylase
MGQTVRAQRIQPYEQSDFDPAIDPAIDRRLVAEVVGWQAILDLHDCSAPTFDDLGWMRRVLLTAAERAEATVVAEKFHRFSPHGISGVVVIAESHLAIHTWPERMYAAVDVFTCSPKLKTNAAVDYLVSALQCGRPEFAYIERGGRRILLSKS